MQAKIETLKAKNGADEEYLVYPRTLIQCVTNENGDSFEDTVKNMVASEVETDIQPIITGTQQVGNAKTIGGHGAEYFVERGEALNTSILEKAVTLDTGMHNFVLGGGGYTGEDLPSAQYAYGIATVNKRGSNGITVLLWATRYVLPLIYNQYNGSKWSGWKEVFTTDGGTVASNTGTPFEISNTTEGANVAFTKYSANGKELGRMGYQGEGVPTIRVPSGQYYQLLHTGNKPSGSYTGNGSATERTIATGGIGNVCYVTGNGLAIVYNGGAILVSNGTVTAVKANEAKFVNGVMTLATTNAILNVNGATLTYQVP